MNALEIVLIIVQLLACLSIVVCVLLQSGKSAGLTGSIFGGNTDSFLARNKQKSFDAKLARATKWLGLVFVVLTVVLLIIAQ